LESSKQSDSGDSTSRQLSITNSSSVPWNPIAAIVLVVVSYFAAQIIAGLIISVYPAIRHMSFSQANDWLDNSVAAQFVYVVLAEGLMLLPLWWFLRLYKCKPAGIGLKRPKAVDILYGLSGFAVYFLIYAAVLIISTQLIPSLNVNQKQQIGFNHAHGIAQLILTAISLVILPPIVEEILMRGFVYTSLKKNLPKIAAAIVTSIIFASAHLEFGSGTPLLWVAAIDTFTLSLVLCYLREKTGRLTPGMLTHALKNSVAFASIFIFHLH
jgi:membrane protease YdiL (CAAX protease family)